MNKIQYIELMKLRGHTQMPKGYTLSKLVEETGGEPTIEEMVKVNKNSMSYYIGLYQDQKQVIKDLQIKVDKWDALSKRVERFYIDKDGNEIQDEGEGLIGIGEAAASAFGWL